MKNILTIAKREWWAYVNSPTAYIVLIAFVVPSYFLYWRQALFSGEASMRSYFALLPWFLLLVIPALTMKTVADEQRKNTIELLLSHAIKEVEVVVGKFLGIWVFYAVIMGVTLSIPATLMAWGNPEIGVLVGQYTGALLLGAAMIAMGILVSTWFKQSVTAFLVSAGIGFVWLLLSLDIITLALPWPLNQVAYELALMTHVDQLARGLIELRDVGYFVTVTIVLLAMAAIKLSELKLVENKPRRAQLYTGAILIAAIGVVLNLVLTSWPVRLDLTNDKRFSLSEGTRITLDSLPDIVSVTLYASNSLPPQVQLLKRDIEDTLNDYGRFGKGKLRTATVAPDMDPAAAQRAEQYGVNQIQFNTVSSGKFAVEAGYLGLVINYGDKYETIGYVQDTGNLEYELTQRIRKLTSTDQKTIGFLSGQGEKSLFNEMSELNTLLGTQYVVETVALDTPEASVSAEVLVVAGPTTPVQATASAKVKEFVDKGGNVMWLLDSVQPNTQLGMANPIETGWDSLLAEYGLGVNKDLAYDVQLNENIRIGQGPIPYVIPYPFWVRAVSGDDSFAAIRNVEGVLLGWPGSVRLDDTKGTKLTRLLQTSRDGGTLEGVMSISPETAPKTGKGQEVLLAAVAEKDSQRMVLVGDSELVSNEFLLNSPANQGFVTNMIDWLVADESTVMVPRRQVYQSLLRFTSPTQPVIAQLGNLVGVPVAIIVFGAWWLRRRQTLTRRMYGE